MHLDFVFKESLLIELFSFMETDTQFQVDCYSGAAFFFF